MRKLTCGLITLLIIGLLLFPSASSVLRSQGLPLFMVYRGDIWAWDGAAVKNRTSFGFNNYTPALSPDGRWIAYKSVARVAADAMRKVGNIGVAGELPTTIWLLNSATNEGRRIADQPADASIFGTNTPDNYIIRSDPTWSPDGSALAWTELTVHQPSASTYRLVTYTVAAKTTRILAKTLPNSDNYEGYASIPVRWGQSGLAVLLRQIRMPNVGASVVVYDENGQLKSTSDVIPNAVEIEWITDGKDDFVATISSGEGKNRVNWTLVNPQDGGTKPINGVPELYNPNVPAGITIYASDAGSTANWRYEAKSGISGMSGSIADVGASGNLTDHLAISPDGSQVAYVNGPSVVVDDGSNQFSPVSKQDIVGLAWGPTRWRVRNATAGLEGSQ